MNDSTVDRFFMGIPMAFPGALPGLSVVSEHFSAAVPGSVVLRGFFLENGAEPDALNAIIKWHLSQETNWRRANAMRILWGHRFQELFKTHLGDFISALEVSSGLELPKVGKAKTSGALNVFGLLSGYAFGYVPREALIQQLSMRTCNGILWRASRKDDRLSDPYSGKRLASVPVELYPWLLSEFKSWKGLPFKVAELREDDSDDDN